MNGADLRKLLPKAKGFFSIDENPGVIGSDDQAWIFEGGDMRPVTRDEVAALGGVNITDNEAADLFVEQPGALDFVSKKNELVNSIEKIRRETNADALRKKAAETTD